MQANDLLRIPLLFMYLQDMAICRPRAVNRSPLGRSICRPRAADNHAPVVQQKSVCKSISTRGLWLQLLAPRNEADYTL